MIAEASLETRAAQLVEALGLASKDEIGTITQLTGGVSSDIARVETPAGPICVKFALAQLKVDAAWHAPIHRNRAEYDWLQTVGDILPSAVPRLLGRDDELGGFAMEFVTGSDVRLWKDDLLGNGPRMGDAEAVAAALAQIHSAARKRFLAREFQNQEDFYALRLSPYFEALKPRHPELAVDVDAVVSQCRENRTVLIHGDVSPKNIFLRRTGPVFLDAECATMGDPAFDVAFCLCHLALKAFHMPGYRDALIKQAHAFWLRYAAGVSWEPVSRLSYRAARLLMLLMLARIDGKSPVEYLNEPTRDIVRGVSKELILFGPRTLPESLDCIGVAL